MHGRDVHATPYAVGESGIYGGAPRTHYRVVLDPKDTKVYVPIIRLAADGASGRVIVEDDVVTLERVRGLSAGGDLRVALQQSQHIRHGQSKNGGAGDAKSNSRQDTNGDLRLAEPDERHDGYDRFMASVCEVCGYARS